MPTASLQRSCFLSQAFVSFYVGTFCMRSYKIVLRNYYSKESSSLQKQISPLYLFFVPFDLTLIN